MSTNNVVILSMSSKKILLLRGENGESFGFCRGCGEKMRAASEEAARGGRKALPDFRRGVPAYYYQFFMGEVILLNYIIQPQQSMYRFRCQQLYIRLQQNWRDQHRKYRRKSQGCIWYATPNYLLSADCRSR